jgi:hypothetical protein
MQCRGKNTEGRTGVEETQEKGEQTKEEKKWGKMGG